MLVSEVVNFSRPYHAILGQPCYVKFKAILSYTYFKLKILRPAGVVTVEAKTQRALDCEQDSNELAAISITVAELRELSLQFPTAPLSLVMPPDVRHFQDG
jgi:hypothetical protein